MIMSSNKKVKFFAWIDIETTGLYGRTEQFRHGEREHDILEIALIITDGDLNVHHKSSYVIQQDIDDIIPKMNEYVFNMHTHSDLLRKIAHGGNKTLETVEKLLIETIEHYCGDEQPVLAGSSIHFDRFFISAQMPDLNDILHYRNFDSSMLKMLHDMMSDEKLPTSREGEPSHVALDDIEHSIEVAKTFIEMHKPKGGLLCFLNNLWK